MTRSAHLQPGEAELQTGLVTLRGSQLVTRTSTSAAVRAGRATARARHIHGVPAGEPRAGFGVVPGTEVAEVDDGLGAGDV
jgi:hypothetical protein